MNDLATIGFTGDVMLGRTLDKVIDQRGYDYPWGNVLPIMRVADVNIVNLETALTSSNIKADKTFNFKAARDKIKSLERAHISIANLANNHILDFSRKGLLDTIETLDSAGIKHVGAGKNPEEANASVTQTIHGITIGVLGLTDNEPAWKANDGPGTNYIDIDDESQYQGVISSVRELRKKTDILIVSIHWGPNMREEPTQRFINFAHLLCDHGTNIIHGHSAHIIQGIEFYNGSLILYDTGDFVDDYAVDSGLRNDLSAYFIVQVKKSGLVSLQIVPTCIHAYQVNEAVRYDREWVIARMQHLSSKFNTRIDEEGNAILRQLSPRAKYSRIHNH